MESWRGCCQGEVGHSDDSRRMRCFGCHHHPTHGDQDSTRRLDHPPAAWGEHAGGIPSPFSMALEVMCAPGSLALFQSPARAALGLRACFAVLIAHPATFTQQLSLFYLKIPLPLELTRSTAVMQSSQPPADSRVMLLSKSACLLVWASWVFFLYSSERLLAGQLCGHASTSSLLPAAYLPLAAFWFELPKLVTFQCKVHFFPPLFPSSPPPALFQEPSLI